MNAEQLLSAIETVLRAARDLDTEEALVHACDIRNELINMRRDAELGALVNSLPARSTLSTLHMRIAIDDGTPQMAIRWMLHPGGMSMVHFGESALAVLRQWHDTEATR